MAPSTPAAVRERIDVLSPLLPSVGSRTASYADEAAAAAQWRSTASAQSAALSFLPVAWEGEGRTLSDWFTGVAESAGTIGRLLEERSEALRPASPDDHSAAFALRTRALGLARDCRTALRAEIAGNAALPRDLEARVFGFLDDLADKRTETGSSSAAGAGAGDVTEAPEV